MSAQDVMKQLQLQAQQLRLALHVLREMDDLHSGRFRHFALASKEPLRDNIRAIYTINIRS